MRDTTAYTVDGQRWPSVTEVISMAGLTDLEWMRTYRPDVLDAAAERGRLAHRWTELVDEGIEYEPTGDPEIDKRVAAYQNFLDDTQFEPEKIEHVVCDETYRYVGTLDRIGRLHNHRERCVVDLKCVAWLHPSTALQTVAYAHASNLTQRYALRLHGKGARGYELRKYDAVDFRLHLDLFLSAVKIAWWRHDHCGLRFEDH